MPSFSKDDCGAMVSWAAIEARDVSLAGIVIMGAGFPVSAAEMAGAIRESAMRNIVAAFAALRYRKVRNILISTRSIREGIRFVVRSSESHSSWMRGAVHYLHAPLITGDAPAMSSMAGFASPASTVTPG